ncbi:MAG: OmpW/AlkL family protein [Acetobacteraceae bacterium]
MMTRLATAFLVSFALLAAIPLAAHAQPTQKWEVSFDVTGVLMHPSASADIAGMPVPGASAAVDNSVTATIDLAYFVTPNIAIDLYAGIPPKTAFKAAGSIGAIGTVATTRYGPAVLSLEYHFRGLGRWEPYVGAGVTYTAFFNTQGAALSNATLSNAWGGAIKAGVRYFINPAWALHFYVQQVFVSTRLSAQLGPLPVSAKVTLDPTVIGAGFSYRF